MQTANDEETATEKFAPVADFTIVRLLLAIVVQKKWYVHQVDYSIEFLQGAVDLVVFVEHQGRF